jgi:ferredoxin
MTLHDERNVDGLVIRIDRSLCVGFGDCVTVAPDFFILDDEGIAVFRASDAPVDRDVLIEACRACPVDALTVIDADGRQIAP